MRHAQEPVTDAEIEAFRAEMGDQREELLEALAEDLGGDPEDYRARDREIRSGG